MKRILNSIKEHAYSIMRCFTFPRMIVTAALCASFISPLFLSVMTSGIHDWTKHENMIEEPASTEYRIDFSMLDEIPDNAANKAKSSVVIADVSESGGLVLTEAVCDEEMCGIKIDFSRDDASVPSIVQYFSSVVRYDTDSHIYWMLANTDQIDGEMLEGKGLDAFVLMSEEKQG